MPNKIVIIQSEQFRVLINPDTVADRVVLVRDPDQSTCHEVARDDGPPLGICCVGVHADEIPVQAHLILPGDVGPISESIHRICPLGPHIETLASIFIAEFVPLAIIDVLVDSDTVGVLALHLRFIKQVGHGDAEINAILVGRFSHPA